MHKYEIAFSALYKYLGSGYQRENEICVKENKRKSRNQIIKAK